MFYVNSVPVSCTAVRHCLDYWDGQYTSESVADFSFRHFPLDMLSVNGNCVSRESTASLQDLIQTRIEIHE